MDDTNITLIVASPRSGTTILGEVLGLHQEIEDWYEPYFIWDFKLPNLPDDLRTSDMATKPVKNFVRDEFERFQKKSEQSFIVEKTPRNAFKIEFINEIFPNARWIHLYRDGRDVVSSIQREWRKRRARNRAERLGDIYRTLGRQTFWRNRFQAINFELRTRQRMLSFLPQGRSDWSEIVGWGPRFPGWQQVRRGTNDKCFAAHQWIECENAIEQGLKCVKPGQILEVRYENLVTDSEVQLAQILEHIGASRNGLENLAQRFSPSSLNRASKDMDETTLTEILPIIEPGLRRRGYI